MSLGGVVKTSVVDFTPKRFKELVFGIQSIQDIVSQAVIEVSDRMLYDLEGNRQPARNGALDSRLGISATSGQLCETCGQGLSLCNGHFGYVKLALPAFHVGYIKLITTILQNICKDCARVLLVQSDRVTFLQDLRKPNIDNLNRTQIYKKINEQCRKAKSCPYCLSVCGHIRKIGVLRIIHDKYQTFNRSTARSKVAPQSKIDFDRSFDEARKHSANQELDKHIHKAVDDLNPLRVLNLFKLVTTTDCELLGINPVEGRPEMFVWQYIPVPPVCIRPSVAQDKASTEDDLTTKLAEIVHISSLIRAALQRGQPLKTIMEQWEFMQLQVAMYVNGEIPGLPQLDYGKAFRGLCQRLKGKQGRFRSNLSGKRVDFSGRTVISPDPNLSVEQVAIPMLIAKHMTYPEKVFKHNLLKLRKRVRNGPDRWPGANTIHKLGEENKRSLKFGDRNQAVQNLKIGDVVERHLEDGDVVLFNRQPSLHKLSIMAHYAKIQPWRTFSFNECVCGPYNADFDGDEMNIHVPQTEEARAEAIDLMGVRGNLCTPKNGEPIISATQDFITASYLLSCKEMFLDRKTFTQLCMYMVDSAMHIDIPPPAILKPAALWTGKQLFSILIRPNKTSPVLINLDARCRDFKRPPVGEPPDMDINDGWLVIRNSQIMCGLMDKSTIGSGKKDSIFYVILRDFGSKAAVNAMDRLTKLASRYLSNQGFSIGIGDVTAEERLTEQKSALVSKAYQEVDHTIELYRTGTLERVNGCNVEETLENSISGLLNKLRQQAGESCIDTLSRCNSPLIMAKSGSKGSKINVAQMVTLVGQQMIAGSRIADGFQDRTLPHFPKHARQPLAKGFILNSFFSGLTPTEFIFHAMSGREGLVDTAVKTAETGYMSRRLMKSLEDLSTRYDDTVRNSSGQIVQFQFGADKLDPVNMEGKGVPVNFDRVYTHSENITWDDDERSLHPSEINALCDELLLTERLKLVRRGLSRNEPLAYCDSTAYAIDEHDSARGFLESISEYVANLALKQAKSRKMIGLGDLDDHPTLVSDMIINQVQQPAKQAYIDRIAKVSKSTLRQFVSLSLKKYRRAQVEPGSAVGALAAQSIGEPGTQMTLRTFHFAGVAGMSITEGVPRIKEIINASKAISTPIITCQLENPRDMMVARVVKGRMEKTYLSEVTRFVEDMWSMHNATICISVDQKALSAMHLDLDIERIAEIICCKKTLRINSEDVTISGTCIFVQVLRGLVTGKGKTSIESGHFDVTSRVRHLVQQIPNIPISGYAEARRAHVEVSTQYGNRILVVGYGLRACMTTEGVIGSKTTTNSVMEVLQVLGIEAARSTIEVEISKVMQEMDIDPRHMQLLADVMTYKGEVLGITRFGMSKMRDSVLQLASFERTHDHLFDAAAGMKKDKIEGVSESIIMGQSMSIGTGAFQIVRQLGLMEGVGLCKRKRTIFEDLWASETKARISNGK